MLLSCRRQRRARSVSPSQRDTTDSSLVALLKARRTWVCRIESALAPLGLSSAELDVLRWLRDAEEPLTHRELAELVSAQATSSGEVVIQRLLTKGFIEAVFARTGDPSARVGITPLGVLRQAEGARALDEVSASFAALVADDERETLDRIVGLVGTNSW